MSTDESSFSLSFSNIMEGYRFVASLLSPIRGGKWCSCVDESPVSQQANKNISERIRCVQISDFRYVTAPQIPHIKAIYHTCESNCGRKLKRTKQKGTCHSYYTTIPYLRHLGRNTLLPRKVMKNLWIINNLWFNLEVIDDFDRIWLIASCFFFIQSKTLSSHCLVLSTPSLVKKLQILVCPRECSNP